MALGNLVLCLFRENENKKTVAKFKLRVCGAEGPIATELKGLLPPIYEQSLTEFWFIPRCECATTLHLCNNVEANKNGTEILNCHLPGKSMAHSVFIGKQWPSYNAKVLDMQ